MLALLSHNPTIRATDLPGNKMLTENGDVAFKDSGAVLVDLFAELEDTISADRLKKVLEQAWAEDALSTLKIIWNARSIHLGKSSRVTFYRAVGWLYRNHPLTLITNLPWLVRPVIRKKAPKEASGNWTDAGKDVDVVDAEDADSDFELIENEDDDEKGEPVRKRAKVDDGLAEFDIKYGVAHGYWKDLLNILALAANNELKVDGDPRKVLNVKANNNKNLRDWTEGKGRRKKTIQARHASAVSKLDKDGTYKALHLSVARLFADQLTLDLARLQSGDRAEKKQISLAAKWAPTHKGMHDQYTCIVSSIAELLYPFDKLRPAGVDGTDRELYLKHARIAYQSQTLSPLRKHIDIVELHLTNNNFAAIQYDRLPSLAMNQYAPVFATKDYEHFEKYVDKVAGGRARMSGATLLPSTLVKHALDKGNGVDGTKTTSGSARFMVQRKIEALLLKTADGQWNTLVQRLRDSGSLSDSIAVCDVSGSMTYPTFSDQTTPLHSAIGLSLLLAEITKPPFGGAFITFSAQPELVRVGGPKDERSLLEKVKLIERSNWGGNTDFEAVFLKLILPMAIENGLKQEDMVKQVFVFSDMHFDAAQPRADSSRWSASFERIKMEFEKAGYKLPRLIFWNLAGSAHGEDNGVAPKPVGAFEQNTALVSGYSQGQMKMFLDSGGFEEVEEVIVETEGENGEVVVKKQEKKQDPLDVVRRAISHDAYRMLKVMD
ncbi:hypothetical protein BDY17DRAFT_252702 [Neohortaea acidophila]|uniref:DUF2828 domain protein n=1 Tax=Neohortaea acidophila TaxID=245834 RepID=A0A6A6PS15_9PEZI|nr:uncharacterized protein BDY17DRAFT_252702 [Neohortaea acidophila]KAF2482007.1 hypothetical protein BDY17DRAFT_252702 [Neohortaea acidophila]